MRWLNWGIVGGVGGGGIALKTHQLLRTTSRRRIHSHSSASSWSVHGRFIPTATTTTTATNTRRFSVSAYSGIPSDGTSGTEVLSLPLIARLPNPTSTTGGSLVKVDVFRTPEEVETGRRLMNGVIVEGKSWPFEEIFETTESFQGYFMSHAAFCVRPVLVANNDDDDDVNDNNTNTNDNADNILGCFYIKPNFPGRCSHICNGGFIVNPTCRGQRVGTLMGATFLPFAKALGYRASYFNLVFASNTASVRLWESLEMERVATLPLAARLEGMPLVDETTTSGGETQLDAAYGYYYNLDRLPDDYDPLQRPGFPNFTP